MTKKLRVLVLVALTVGILSGTASAFEGNTVGVYLQENGSKGNESNENGSNENGERVFITSYASTVEGLLFEQGIILDEFDVVEPSIDSVIENGSRVTVTRGVTVNVSVDGDIFRNRPVRSKQMMVSEFVAQYAAATGTDYMFDMSMWNAPLEDGMYVSLTTRKTEEFTSYSELPFEIVFVDDASMYEGNDIWVSEGEKGELTTVTRVDYIGGEEVAREIVSEEVSKEPVNAVILRGTSKITDLPSDEAHQVASDAIIAAQLEQIAIRKAELAELARLEAERIEAERIAAEKEAKRKEAERIERERLARIQEAEDKLAQIGLGKVAVKKVLTMSSTAYTADYECTGKNPGDPGFGITYTGMKARVGVVAVDPSVIPLGSKLFIEGYGEAIAGDTGSAIYGNRIDLYFNTNKECKQYGRKTIQVYVLK